MKITSVSYGKTINVGNYQSVRVEYTADVQDDVPSSVLQTLKEQVADDEVKIREANKPINVR